MSRYKVIANFYTLDDDGDWFKDYQVGDILWRDKLRNETFTDEDGEVIRFRREDIKDYVVKVG